MSKEQNYPESTPTARGNVARRQGYYYRAAHDFNRAIAESQTTAAHSKASASRGVAKVGMGFIAQFDADGLPGAIEDLEAAVAASPDDGWAWAQLGEAYRIYGRDEFKILEPAKLATLVSDSLAAFNKALMYMPENRAWILAHRGATHFLNLVATHQEKLSGPGSHSNVAFTLDVESDSYEQAERDFKDAIASFPNYAWAKEFYAFLLTAAGKHKKAMSFLGEAIIDAGTISTPLLRSLSLLYRYSASMEVDLKDQVQSLEQAVFTGQKVLAADYEDYIATYTVAVSALELGYPEARDVCRTARNKLINTLARLIPFIATLHHECGDERELSEILSERVRPVDIETAAILGQDPLWNSGKESANGYHDLWKSIVSSIEQ